MASEITTFKIEAGAYAGDYTVNAAGKIQQIMYSGNGPIPNTVPRGCARHKAATESLAT